MIDRLTPVTEDELHALVDGELAPERRRDVEAWLAGHPDDAARVAAWRAHAEAMRQRYGGIADEPAPPGLDLDRLDRGRKSRWALAAAAIVAAFLLGGAAGWYAHSTWDGAPVVRTVAANAIDAHKLYIVEVRHPVEVPANAAHLMPWLSKRVGHQLRAPDLQQIGLKLIGGRLLPGPRGPAALLMYEGPSGERFTLYAARATGPDTALRYSVSGQIAAFYWIEGEFGFVVTGPANRERLQKIASATYEQLERPPGRNPG